MCSSFSKQNVRPPLGTRRFRRSMPILIALVATLLALLGCKNDEQARRDADRAVAEEAERDEDVTREWKEAGSQISEGAEETGEAIATTTREAGREVKKGVKKAGSELAEVGEDVNEGAEEVAEDINEEWDEAAGEVEEEIEEERAEERAEDVAEFKAEARTDLDRIKADVKKLQKELDEMGETVAATFRQEFEELEVRAGQLERKMRALEEHGVRAWSDAKKSLKTSLDRLEEDVERFEEKLESGEEITLRDR